MMMRAFLALIKRDVVLAMRIGGGGGLSLLFFLVVVILVPFSFGPDLNTLSRLSPAIVWLGAVLATLLGLDRLLQADEEDGALDVLRQSHLPLELVVLAKVIAHWLTTGLPLTLAAPFLGLLVALPTDVMPALIASLLVGTPTLTCIGAIGAALTVHLRRGGLLSSILVVPFMIPILIFGVSCVSALTSAGGAISFITPFLMLCALSLIACLVGVLASAFALRNI